MKRAILLLTAALCLVLTDGAHAQRALPGMRALEVRGGMADGFHSKKNRHDTGYYFGAAMATYARHADKWVFGGEYLYLNTPYKDGHIPLAQFTGEGGYYRKFLSDGSKTVFFSLGASALAGYETVNWGESLLYDGATVEHEDSFIYGGAITLEMEAYLTDRVVLVLSGRERALWGTSTGRFHFQFGVGVRVIIH